MCPLSFSYKGLCWPQQKLSDMEGWIYNDTIQNRDSICRQHLSGSLLQEGAMVANVQGTRLLHYTSLVYSNPLSYLAQFSGTNTLSKLLLPLLMGLSHHYFPSLLIWYVIIVYIFGITYTESCMFNTLSLLSFLVTLIIQ